MQAPSDWALTEVGRPMTSEEVPRSVQPSTYHPLARLQVMALLQLSAATNAVALPPPASESSCKPRHGADASTGCGVLTGGPAVLIPSPRGPKWLFGANNMLHRPQEQPMLPPLASAAAQKRASRPNKTPRKHQPGAPPRPPHQSPRGSPRATQQRQQESAPVAQINEPATLSVPVSDVSYMYDSHGHGISHPNQNAENELVPRRAAIRAQADTLEQSTQLVSE